MKITLSELKKIIRRIIKESNNENNEYHETIKRLLDNKSSSDLNQVSSLVNSLEDTSLTIYTLTDLYIQAFSEMFKDRSDTNYFNAILECKDTIENIPPYQNNKQEYDDTLSDFIDDFINSGKYSDIITDHFNEASVDEKYSDDKPEIIKLGIDIKLAEIGKEDPPPPTPAQKIQNYNIYGKTDLRTEISTPLILNYIVGTQEHFLGNLINTLLTEDVEGWDETNVFTSIKDQNTFDDNFKEMFYLGFKEFLKK